METFGEKLRKQREQRGITLEAISNTTKISTRMLRALEEQKFEQLPGGVFNKGFVRAYARQVGLDEEQAITDYLAALSEGQVHSQKILPDLLAGQAATIAESLRGRSHENHAHEKLVDEDTGPDAHTGAVAAVENPAAADRRRGHDRRNDRRRNEESRIEENLNDRTEELAADRHGPNKGPWQIENRPASDLLSAVHGKQNNSPAGESRPSFFATGTFGENKTGEGSNLVPWSVLAATLLVICSGLAFWNVHRHKQTLQSRHSEAAPVASTQTSMASPTMEPAVMTTLSTGSKETLEKLAQAKREKTSAATRGPVGIQNSDASPSIAVTKPSLTLLIRADQTTWVSITADGKLVAEETLIAPAEKSIRASSEIVVKAGNAAGVSFLLNSKEIPAEGKDGEVKTYIFDASGMKVSRNAQLSGND
ncbi:MAG: helix-turn-helix domain-containing protein [Candidatus Sulfotelmatobacter sp.]